MVEETKNDTDEQTEITDEKKSIPEIDSKYRMIILAAQRSKQLQRGATPRVDADMRKQKPTRVAMKELKEEKIDFEILEN
jgi:DNA-directed RNA polymerase subunit omega